MARFQLGIFCCRLVSISGPGCGAPRGKLCAIAGVALLSSAPAACSWPARRPARAAVHPGLSSSRFEYRQKSSVLDSDPELSRSGIQCNCTRSGFDLFFDLNLYNFLQSFFSKGSNSSLLTYIFT
jgi:hypothetical protein